MKQTTFNVITNDLYYIAGVDLGRKSPGVHFVNKKKSLVAECEYAPVDKKVHINSIFSHRYSSQKMSEHTIALEYYFTTFTVNNIQYLEFL
jgi:hypothetical protein